MDKRKILLADDSAAVRKVVTQAFADEGMDVTAVGNGDAAMSAFVEDQPDLVMLDVYMPGMTGLQLCEMIKEDATTRDTPVILLTGSYEKFEPEEAERAGADSYFVKPFPSIRDVVDTANALIDRRDRRRNGVAETEDIDGLYKQSFEPGTEDPDEPAIADLAYSEADDDAGELIVEPLSDEADLTSGLRAEPPFHSVASYEPESTDSAERDDESDDDQFVPPEPGEFSFDELIEDDATISISRPAAEAVSENNAPAIRRFVDPFAEPATKLEPGPSAQPDRSPAAPRTGADAGKGTVSSLSPELIDEIVDRVVERMSDQVIREIAEQTVPRITKRLLREALEKEIDLTD